MLGAVAAVLAPADCRVCGGPLLLARRYAVCESCVEGMRAETAPLCAHCGERLLAEDASGFGFGRSAVPLCHACQSEPPQFVRATAFGAYDGMLRTLIRLHKFEGVEALAAPLGERLASAMTVALAEMPAGPVHVVAVPLHGKRRRYNQSVQIVEAAMRAAAPHAGHMLLASHAALERVRATESQSHLSPAQRRNNVRGAFAVRGDVRGWQVMLVDDVFTTGATVAECTRTLLRAGAAAVHVLTLARTQPERTVLWHSQQGEGWTYAGGAAPAVTG